MDEIVYRIINFVILFGALGFACRKMIKNMFGGRREKISRELAEAEDAKERAKSLQGDMESARLKNEERRAKLMEDARLQAEMTKRETERSGELEAQSLKDNALQSEPQLRKEMQSRVAADAIRKVAQTASEVLKDGSFEASKQALNERFIQQIKDLVSAMPSDILNMNELKKLDISIKSAEPLSDEEMQRITRILCETFISCRNEVDSELIGGVRMQVGDTVYDGTLSHQLDRLSRDVESNTLMSDKESLSVAEEIRNKLRATDGKVDVFQTGTVVTLGDGICRVSGLADVMAGEMLEFPGGLKGMVQDLERDNVGVVLMGDFSHIQEGDEVRRTGRIIEVPVGDCMIGRVVDAMGTPIDDKGPLNAQSFRAVESPHRACCTERAFPFPCRRVLKRSTPSFPSAEASVSL